MDGRGGGEVLGRTEGGVEVNQNILYEKVLFSVKEKH